MLLWMAALIRCSPFVMRLIMGIWSHLSTNAPISHRVVSLSVGISWNHDSCVAMLCGTSTGALLFCSFFIYLSISHATIDNCAVSCCSSGTSFVFVRISSSVCFHLSLHTTSLLSDGSEMSKGYDSDLVLGTWKSAMWKWNHLNM